MRVVHFSTIHKPFDVRIFHKECRTLAAAGHEVHLLIPDPPVAERDGVHLHPLPLPRCSFRPKRIWRRLTRTFQLAWSLHGDVYHFHDPELIPVGLRLKQRGALVVYDAHEDSPREALAFNRRNPVRGYSQWAAWHCFEWAARRCFDAFVAATPFIADKFPAERTVCVHNYPCLDDFTSSPDWGQREHAVLYAGSITSIRGIREMIEAVHRVPQARLILIGEFAPADLLEETRQQPGWNKVEYLGWQTRSEAIQHYQRARIGLAILHPTPIFVDSLPNKLFEYMAAGLAVVASDFPSWRRILENFRCGLVVDPLDPRSVAEAIDYLLSHPDEAAAMGRRGREAALSHFNWDTEAKKLVKLYDQLSQPQRRAS
ncbi:MAG: glycosyltransferase WbpH [Gemmatales bacterium]|nr:MAG: glycosyltransferase WbpH [Gemmatales bacterium]